MIRFLAFLCIVTAVSSTINCSNWLCHTPVICFKKPCRRYAKMLTITDSMKQILVDNHNDKRNLIAGGGVAGHSPACRMATMQWDDKLAATATFGVRQCINFEDRCYNTTKFNYSGKLSLGLSLRNLDYKTYLKIMVDIWYSGVLNSTQSYIDSFPDGAFEYFLYTFATMVADRNIRIGCAATASVKHNNLMFDCMYATTYKIGFPIYNSCEKAATSCKTGTNPKYPYLCSTSEKYDVNKWDK